MISSEGYNALQVGDLVKLDRPLINARYTWQLVCPYATVTRTTSYPDRGYPDTLSLYCRIFYINQRLPEGAFAESFLADQSQVLYQVERQNNEGG